MLEIMSSSSNHRKIQRVPALLLAEEKKKKKQQQHQEENDYYPKVVSIGPYHYGKPELAVVEAFKPLAVELFVGGPEQVDFFYHKVLEVIGEVRNCYEEESVAKFSDADLAQLMLRDASLIIIEMEIYLQHGDKGEWYRKRNAMIEHLGRLTGAILFRDFILVENQIPLRVIQLLLKLRHGEEEMTIDKYVKKCIFGEDPGRVIPSQAAPLHLLEFMHMLLILDPVVEPEMKSSFCGLHLHSTPVTAYRGLVPAKRNLEIIRSPPHASGNWDKKVTHSFRREMDLKAKGIHFRPSATPLLWDKKVTHSFRRVMDLKAKGIHFRPSATPLLRDMKFKSQFFHATLHLPESFVSHYSKPLLKNLVAYEFLPGIKTDPVVTSYIDFMKSLVEKPEDVKELRERKILYSQLGSDEEVVDVYRDINTHGTGNDNLFFKVREEIQAHYNSRIKTWIAELIHTHFRSPWTFTAFLAAAAIIALTAAQPGNVLDLGPVEIYTDSIHAA